MAKRDFQLNLEVLFQDGLSEGERRCPGREIKHELSGAGAFGMATELVVTGCEQLEVVFWSFGDGADITAKFEVSVPDDMAAAVITEPASLGAYVVVTFLCDYIG